MKTYDGRDKDGNWQFWKSSDGDTIELNWNDSRRLCHWRFNPRMRFRITGRRGGVTWRNFYIDHFFSINGLKFSDTDHTSVSNGHVIMQGPIEKRRNKTGIRFKSKNKANGFTVKDVVVNGFDTACKVTGDTEQGIFKNVKAVGNNRSYVIEYDGPTPGIMIEQGHSNAARESLIVNEYGRHMQIGGPWLVHYAPQFFGRLHDGRKDRPTPPVKYIDSPAFWNTADYLLGVGVVKNGPDWREPWYLPSD